MQVQLELFNGEWAVLTCEGWKRNMQGLCACGKPVRDENSKGLCSYCFKLIKGSEVRKC